MLSTRDVASSMLGISIDDAVTDMCNISVCDTDTDGTILGVSMWTDDSQAIDIDSDSD